jgi:leader peptidase (prepilin peptidase)/N-methyltransferase
MGFLLVFFSNGFMIDILLAKNLVFLSFGVAIIFIDIKHYIIPDVLSIPLVVIGLGLAFFTDEPGWMSSLLGSVVGFSLFYLIAFSYFKRKKVDGLGGGDIKLIAGIGAFIGVVGVFYVMFLSSFIALLVFSVKLILEHKRRTVSGEDCAAQDIIPFGPFLVVATIVYMLFGGKMLEWYMSLFYGWL